MRRPWGVGCWCSDMVDCDLLRLAGRCVMSVNNFPDNSVICPRISGLVTCDNVPQVSGAASRTPVSHGEHHLRCLTSNQVEWSSKWAMLRLKQTVKFNSNLCYSNFQRCFKAISLSLMVGKSGNYWKVGIWGFCYCTKFNYEVKLETWIALKLGLFCALIQYEG